MAVHGVLTGCADRVRMTAAELGNIEILEYLQLGGIMATADVRTRTLNITGTHNQLAAAQWLRQQGAEWPDALHYHGGLWSGATLAWARAEGCTSPFW
jgi:hypothetical protein